MKHRIAGFLLAAITYAQTTPNFEVASIRPSNSADHRPLFDVQPGGRFIAKNVSVKRLIEWAYGIKNFQISGGPGWIGSDLFDISAKPESSANADKVDLMLQSLLAERFDSNSPYGTRPRKCRCTGWGSPRMGRNSTTPKNRTRIW